uniref:Uncharacterized protein n=1 Tax=Anguilla anguilla TaxID=7936 RepID=A0A0E9PUS4_ANGAN
MWPFLAEHIKGSLTPQFNYGVAQSYNFD